MSLNRVMLIGNTTNDPKISYSTNGKEIAFFNLATNESYKDKNSGEKKQKTEFHKICVFSQGLVNVIKNYVKKGSKLYIEGQLQTRKWTDKEGVERYVTEVVMQNFNSNLIMLNSKNDGEGGYKPASEQKSSHDKSFEEVEQAFESDDIPF